MTVIRRGGHQDVPFMRSMLTHAYNWHVNVFDTDVPIGRYVDGWGRPGDTVLIAMDGGHRVGAGWIRIFRETAPGYGFIDENTPELTVAVVPTRQGEGIGMELLRGLLDRARPTPTAPFRSRWRRTIPRSRSSRAKGSSRSARRHTPSSCAASSCSAAIRSAGSLRNVEESAKGWG